MRIKVAFLDDDKNYLQRLSSVLSAKFADKLEIYSFSNSDMVVSEIMKNKIDVLIASENFDINADSLPGNCGFAYLVAVSGVDMIKGQKAICRFQKAEIIFKEILAIYSENVSDSISIKFEGDGKASVISFFSASGGTGASTAAAACAKRIARAGKKVLYLNLEQFGNTEHFFHGDGQFDLSNVIFALKSKKSSSVLKMASYVKEDASGVCFYSSPMMALDVIELTKDDVSELISTIKMMNTYEFVVVDADFSFSPVPLKLLELSQCAVFVSDGTEIANDKFVRAYRSLENYEQQKNKNLVGRIALLYNRFSSKSGKVLDEGNIKVLGGMHKIENASVDAIVDEMINGDYFNKIISKNLA